MSNSNSTKQDHEPKEKKNPPLGKWLLFKLLSLNNFPFGRDRNKEPLLTTVSNHEGQSQIQSRKQEDEGSTSQALDKPASKRNTVWSIKIFLN